MQILLKKQECTGCSACTSICPKKCLQMKIDEEGFWSPYLKSEEILIDTLDYSAMSIHIHDIK